MHFLTKSDWLHTEMSVHFQEMFPMTEAVLVAMKSDDVESFVEETQNHVSLDLVILPNTAPREEEILWNKLPLISAAAYYHALEIVKYLVMNGVDCTIPDWHGRLPVHYAAMGGSIEIVQQLESTGIDVSVRDPRMKSVVHYAAEFGRKDLLAWFWANGVDVDSTHKNGWSCLHFAAWHGKYETTKLLLDIGVDPNLETRFHQTAIQFASIMGHTHIIRLLLEYGARVTGDQNNDPVFWAAKRGNSGAIQLLLNNGGDPNAKNSHNETASMVAGSLGFTDALAVLLDSGANVNGKSLKKIAKRRGHKDIVKMLRKRGVK